MPQETRAAPPPRKHPMVGWFDPGQLLATGLQVYIWSRVGQGRAMEEAARYRGYYRYRLGHEVWFDFLADTGDGWRSTYAVASLLAQPELLVREHVLPRGRFLIMGGDEVYPVASSQNYRERLVAPFHAALPSSDPPLHLFAVPGNHDWYDGLVSFTRRFTQHRWIGGWWTRQDQSYFAVQLPQRWWLWATDVLPGTDMDFGQREYFRGISRHLEPGDRVILVSAQPEWLYPEIKQPAVGSNLLYIEKELIEPRGARVYLWLSGDLHHYRRHQDARDPNRQRIVSGGGGAYLSLTHEPLLARDGTDTARTVMVGQERFEQQYAYPNPATSFRLSFLNLVFLFKNWKLAPVAGLIYAAMTWGLTPRAVPWEELPRLAALLERPAQILWMLAVVLGFILFADRQSPVFRWIGGAVHGIVHIAAALTIAYWAGTQFHKLLFAPLWQILSVFVGGAIVGPIILGLYLLVAANIFGAHGDHAAAALRIPHFKHVLRLHIAPDGTLEIYPIGIARVPRDGEAHAQYFLIEGPIRIRPG